MNFDPETGGPGRARSGQDDPASRGSCAEQLRDFDQTKIPETDGT
jgi:hypothetical protein